VNLRTRTLVVGLTSATCGGLLAVACTSAVLEEHALGSYSEWAADTVLLAGAVEGTLLGPVQMMEWSRDTIILSDAISGRLLWYAVSEGGVSPVLDRRYRPVAPVFVERLSNSALLVGGPAAFLEAVDIARGRASTIEIPVSNWGEHRVGRYAVETGGTVIMAPWSAGRFWPTKAAEPSTEPSLVRFDPATGVLLERFGPVLQRHHEGLAESINNQVALAGFVADSLVLVNLHAAEVKLYAPDHTSGEYREGRSFTLPLGFWARPTEEPEPGSRLVEAQFQLADAVVGSGPILVVLRHTTYRWVSWNPLLHRRGDWLPILALEAYDLSGTRLRAAKVGAGPWRGLRASRDGHSVYLYSPGTGNDPTQPVVVRYQLD
jgi:hypothetical protein